jgi:hypothetical protein
VTVANTTFQPWASSFRIKKLVVFPSLSPASIENAYAEWNTSLTAFVKDVVKSNAVPEGTTMPTSFTFTPPVKSLASDWITTSSTIFNLFVPTGSIIDFYVDYTISASIIPPTIAVSAGAALGKIAYLPLDGSSNTLVQIALPTAH